MRVVILGNGTWGNPNRLHQALRKGDLLIACDGAYAKAIRYGLKPQIVIGDIDSLSLKFFPRGVQVLRFPQDKNETDAELALDLALGKKPKEILWIAPFGGRWDHSFANLFLLTKAAEKKIPVRLFQGQWEIQLILSHVSVHGTPGQRISLVPLSEEVRGVTTKGLKYPLRDDILRQRETRGVSNVFAARRAVITISRGWLLALYPRRLGGVKIHERKNSPP